MSQLEPCSAVAVLGPGPFSLFILQAAKSTGPRKLIMVGLSEDRKRLSLAKELGADDVIEAGKIDPVEEVKRLTEGQGVDVVIEAAGRVEAVSQGIEMLAPGGFS